MEFQISLFEAIVTSVLTAGMVSMFVMIWRFIKEQREVNKANRRFIRSMQRAEIIRYFRIVVEQGNPITPEELEHLHDCYKAYHDSGGNGSGTFMYEKIIAHARLITTAKEGEDDGAA